MFESVRLPLRKVKRHEPSPDPTLSKYFLVCKELDVEAPTPTNQILLERDRRLKRRSAINVEHVSGEKAGLGWMDSYGGVERGGV